MKKLFAITLCTFIIVCAVLPIGATCAHSYTEEHVKATCISRAYTLYSCEGCGDTYCEYDRLYTAPESCYMVLEGDRSGDTLTVTVSLGNNPGFWANRLTLNYNAEALEAVSTENGTVWGDSALITVNSAPTSGSPYIRYYCQNSDFGDNTANGTLFTATFNIKSTMDQWGISLSANARDNINYDHENVSFEIVDTVTMGYGDHSYDDGKITLEPTYDTEGIKEYTCTLCSYTKAETVPHLERPPVGDVNGDNLVDMRDSLAIKLHVADSTKDDEYIAEMDVNEDGKINAKDLLILKKIIAGVWEYN